VDFDRQGAPPQGQAIDPDSLLTDLFTDPNQQAQAQPGQPLQPPPLQQPQQGQTLLNPPGIPSPVANPAGQGEAVIERAGGGAVVPGAPAAQATPPRRRARRATTPKFKNNTEARWYYAKRAWIVPNQADKLPCQNSYASNYTLYHLRCINRVQGFGD
jgi:hypothetical protein